MKVTIKKLSVLKHPEKNVRIHSEQQIRELKRSLEKFGQTRALVIDENNIIHDVEFIGGCNGNLQGISKLIEGQSAQNVIDKCQGIHCGMRPTSCPDQLSRALSEAIQK